MVNLNFTVIFSILITGALSAYKRSYGSNQILSPTESYIGPSSYATSFQFPISSEYPSYGNFGNLINLKNPQIATSYTSFGPSESNEFGSTTYINYPESTTYEQAADHGGKLLVSGQDIASYLSQNSHFPSSYSSLTNLSNEEIPISQHIEVTKPVVVPVYKKFPYAVKKKIPVAIPHPVLVPIPAPYPVNVIVSEPVAVPVIKEIRVPVEKEFMYPVEKKIPVEVEKPVQYHVEKHYPIYVQKPYPVKIPIIKTIVHKNQNKW